MVFGHLEGPFAISALTVSLIGQLGMFSLELMAIKVDGPRAYFSDGWNVMDQIIVPVYLTFFILSLQNPVG